MVLSSIAYWCCSILQESAGLSSKIDYTLVDLSLFESPDNWMPGLTLDEEQVLEVGESEIHTSSKGLGSMEGGRKGLSIQIVAAG